jgi:hypothetical protein
VSDEEKELNNAHILKHQDNNLSGWDSSLPCKWCGFHSPPNHASVTHLWSTQSLWGLLGQLVILKGVGTEGLGELSKGGTIKLTVRGYSGGI